MVKGLFEKETFYDGAERCDERQNPNSPDFRRVHLRGNAAAFRRLYHPFYHYTDDKNGFCTCLDYLDEAPLSKK